MSLAENIVKYRQKNQLSQTQLANELSISRQSISKWETGENLPSIDNLISLSGLLDISLDELITGEPYLHFPFDFGRPASRKAAILLIIFFALIVGIFSAPTDGGWLVVLAGWGIAAMVYILSILFLPWDFKQYYNYWTLNKTGITYVAFSKLDESVFKELIIPIKALFHMRKTNYIAYRDIKQIEVKVDLYEIRPSKTLIISGFGDASNTQSMREKFYMILTMTDGQKISLDLSRYYWSYTKERKMLPAIISFLQRKKIPFIDKQGIIDIINTKDSILINELYTRKESRER